MSGQSIILNPVEKVSVMSELCNGKVSLSGYHTGYDIDVNIKMPAKYFDIRKYFI